jgi:hypothetical protein
MRDLVFPEYGKNQKPVDHSKEVIYISDSDVGSEYPNPNLLSPKQAKKAPKIKSEEESMGGSSFSVGGSVQSSAGPSVVSIHSSAAGPSVIRPPVPSSAAGPSGIQRAVQGAAEGPSGIQRAVQGAAEGPSMHSLYNPRPSRDEMDKQIAKEAHESRLVAIQAHKVRTV